MGTQRADGLFRITRKRRTFIYAQRGSVQSDSPQYAASRCAFRLPVRKCGIYHLPPIPAFRGFYNPRESGWHFAAPDWTRSEEHTSELQSRGHLVCRLLLEKRK